MAGKAAQPALALAKTSAGDERGRLMAHVPGIGEIHRFIGPKRHAMAEPTEFVQFFRGEFPRIESRSAGWIARVRCQRTMAGLASDAEFKRHNGFILRKMHRPCGMTRKTSQDIGGGIE
jgi:hypothetical protein